MNYLQTIADLPWNTSQEENLDPAKAEVILDRDHYGLDQIKQRIIQFLAVRKLTKDNQGSILCFYGPPGVGKTSLGKSIAEALNRKFYRVALGGVRDEAEIRGHRRTYVGSMPGVIISSLKKIKTNNPVFLLDEIDKMGKDARGDPGAALLEVLDPAQNNKFTDHYLSTPFDLSKIMFIATANSLETIHPALLDRMEVIDLSGYSIDEKLQIAKQYLVPRQVKQNGITEAIFEMKDPEIRTVITEYTMESGVRNLERAIGSICRTVAYKYAVAEEQESFEKVTVDNAIIQEALGNKKIDSLLHERITKPGVAIGLAYTSVGGRCLLIETTKFPGSGQVSLTGQLGDVMKESITTSLSWIKTNAVRMGLLPIPPLGKLSNSEVVRVIKTDAPDARNLLSQKTLEHLMQKWDLHVHFPAASTPKDGPSAGVTITVALVSLFCGRRVRADFAMTGEISLQGLVLPVGGIKEKVMAAHRNGLKNVILPKKNDQDLDDVPEDLRNEIKVHFVSTVEEALKLALEDDIDSEFLKQELMPAFRPKL